MISNSYAQVPRGEAPESMVDSSGDPVGILFVLALIHIYLGFKEGVSQGLLNLAHISAIAGVVYFFPKLGSLVIAALLAMLLYIIIKDYLK